MVLVVLLIIFVLISVIAVSIYNEVLFVIGIIGMLLFTGMLISYSISNGVDHEYHLEEIQKFNLTTIQIPYIKDESKEELSDRIFNFFQAKNKKRKLEQNKNKPNVVDIEVIEPKEEIKLKGYQLKESKYKVTW